MNELVSLSGLIISFSLIIFLVANKKNFGVAMILGALILGILSNPYRLAQTFYETIADWEVDTLIVIVMLIKILATVLEETGQIPLVVENLKRIIPERGMLAIIPFIFGLLPVPGGALLSAPMVDAEGRRLGVSNEGKTFLNLWFRHIGFLVFPLATALIVMSQISEVNINRLIVIQTPIFIVSLILGLLYVIKLSGKVESADVGKKEGVFAETMENFMPLFVTIALTLILSIFISLNISFLIALPSGIVLSLLIYRGGGRSKMLRKGFSPSIGLAVFSIMLYKNIANASGVAEIVAKYLQHTSMPALVIIPLLSFVIGVLTAHNMAAIALAYPMLSPIIGNDVHLISLLYVSSFMGYLISPLHLCVVVSYDYFKPRFIELYKLMLPPAVLMVVIAVAFSIWG
jgi:integral membrane protein (TIGR00529 family)